MARVVILCDGDFPKQERSLRHLREATDLVCCDASIVKLTAYYGTERLEAVSYTHLTLPTR